MRSLNVYVAYRDVFDLKMQADWVNFKLVLFSLLQNAVKYNCPNGEVFVIISRKKHKKKNEEGQERERGSALVDHTFSNYPNLQLGNQSQEQILEIEIIDTGEGILPDRQSMLFIPFLELKQLQGLMKKPKNDNIGLGLSASRQIVRELKGDLKIK